jgi:hypothetical protein
MKRDPERVPGSLAQPEQHLPSETARHGYGD